MRFRAILMVFFLLGVYCAGAQNPPVSSNPPADPVSRIKPYRIEGSSYPGQIIVADQYNDGRWSDSLYYWEGVLVINRDTAVVEYQVVDLFSIASDVLSISLSNDNQVPLTVDLSPYLDNTDDQQVDNFSLVGTTLTLELETDGQAPHTVDLSSLQDGTGTDDQTLSYTLGGTLSIEAGNTVDLSDLLDNTDDQAVDNFSIASDILTLEIESDGQAAHTVNLNPYLDNTDNQTLSYGGAGSLSISGGNSVDLSDLLDNTDNQILTLAGDNLSLTNGGTVDLSPYLDNTDNQTVDSFLLTGTLLTLTLEDDNEAPYTVDIASAVGDDDWRFTGTEDYESHAYRNGRTSIATTAATHGLRVDSTFQFRVDGGSNIFDWQDGTGVSDLPGLIWRAEGGAEGSGAFINGENNLVLATTQEPVLNRQVLGSVVFSGQDPNSTANITPGAFIKAYANGNWTTSSNTTEMEFYITLDGETSSTSMLRLLKNDRVDLPTYFDKDDGLPTSIIGRSTVGHLTRHPVTGTPTDGQVLKAQSGALVWSDDNEGAGSVNVDLNLLRDTLTQTGHGYTQTQTPLPFFVDQSTGDLLPAVNDFDSTTHVGFIVEVLNVDELVVATGGVHVKTAHGYTVGKEYFTTGTAHTYATQAPAGEINDWVWSVLDANRLLLHNVRPYNPSADDEQTLSIDEATAVLTISGGNSVDISEAVDEQVANLLTAGTNVTLNYNDGANALTINSPDDQALSLVGNSLTLQNGGSVDLSGYLDNTDSQTLTPNAGTTSLTISGGNSVSLSELVDDRVDALLVAGTDIGLSYNDVGNTLTINYTGSSSGDPDQTLSFTSPNLTISGAGGNTVDLSALQDGTGTDDQGVDNFSLSGNTLTLEVESDGQAAHTVSLAAYLDNTDTQDLSLAGTILSLTDGGSVDIGDVDASNEIQFISINSSGSTLSFSLSQANTTNFNLFTDITMGGGGSQLNPLYVDTTYIATQYDLTNTTATASNGLSIETGSGDVILGGPMTQKAVIEMENQVIEFNADNNGGTDFDAVTDSIFVRFVDGRGEVYGFAVSDGAQPGYLVMDRIYNSDFGAMIVYNEMDKITVGSLTDELQLSGQTFYLNGVSGADTLAAGTVDYLLGYNSTTGEFGPTTQLTTGGGGGSSGAFSTTSNVTSNAPGDYLNDDFVFGSPQLDDNGTNDSRMFFDVSKGSFYSNEATGTQYDDANRGFNVFNASRNSITSAYASAAVGGQDNTVSGAGAAAIGCNGCELPFSYSVAIGEDSEVLEPRAFAHGNGSFDAGEVGQIQYSRLVLFGDGTGTSQFNVYASNVDAVGVPTDHIWTGTWYCNLLVTTGGGIVDQGDYNPIFGDFYAYNRGGTMQVEYSTNGASNLWDDADMSNSDVELNADNTNKAVQVRVQPSTDGNASMETRCVCVLEFVQTAY